MSWVFAFCYFSRILGTSEHIVIYDQLQDGELFSIPSTLTVACTCLPSLTVTITTGSALHRFPATLPLRLTLRFFSDHLHLFLADSSPPLLIPAHSDAASLLVFYRSPSTHVTPSNLVRTNDGSFNSPALTWGLCGAGALLVAVGVVLMAKKLRHSQSAGVTAVEATVAAVEVATLEEGRAPAATTSVALIAAVPSDTAPLEVPLATGSSPVTQGLTTAVQAVAKAGAVPVFKGASAKASRGQTAKRTPPSEGRRGLMGSSFGGAQLTQEEKQILSDWYELLVYRERVQQQYRGG